MPLFPNRRMAGAAYLFWHGIYTTLLYVPTVVYNVTLPCRCYLVALPPTSIITVFPQRDYSLYPKTLLLLFLYYYPPCAPFPTYYCIVIVIDYTFPIPTRRGCDSLPSFPDGRCCWLPYALYYAYHLLPACCCLPLNFPPFHHVLVPRTIRLCHFICDSSSVPMFLPCIDSIVLL